MFLLVISGNSSMICDPMVAGLVPTAMPAYQAAYGQRMQAAFAPAGYYYPGMEILDLGQWYPF